MNARKISEATMRNARRAIWVLAGVCVCLWPAPAWALRVISISVELDGKVVLSGDWGDSGYASPYLVWRYLRTAPLRPVQGFAVKPDPERPFEAVIRGKIRVKVQYGAEAGASELKLERNNKFEEQWLIDSKWVEENGPPGDPVAEENKLSARLADHASERTAYRRGSFLTIGFAAVSALASLTALLLCLAQWLGRGGSRGLLTCSAGAAVTFAALAVVWRFLDTPLFPDDERSYELRIYAVYAAAISAGVAVFCWIMGLRRPRAAESADK